MRNTRIYAIDIIRALTMSLMIFVNDIPGIKNIPQWLNHMPAGVDGLGLADIVFPLFLFIVGLSIPYAIENRLKKGQDKIQVGVHILVRTFALLVIGVFMVNVGSLNEELTGLNKNLWALLSYVCIFMVWNKYPEKKSEYARIFKVLRYIGIGGLVWLAVIYRSGTVEVPEFMQVRWWGILGLIGWAYFTGAVVNLMVRDNLKVMTMVFICFLVYHVLYSLNIEGWSTFQVYSLLPGKGAFSAMVIAGVWTSLIMRRYMATENLRKMFVTWLGAGLLFLILGFITRSLWGISKNDATPSWIYICLAIGLVVFTFIFWLVDVKKRKNWAHVLEPAGNNTLTTYLIPNLVYYSIWYCGVSYPDWLNQGVAGLFRSIVFVYVILVVSGLLTRFHVRLKL
ncbi:DUF5009 domain-containing protein [Marinilabiliaceae bacterium JC017]|nr:DUF5009 domain-containing protein [Marinilabiliaceae bacterium JC017]